MKKLILMVLTLIISSAFADCPDYTKILHKENDNNYLYYAFDEQGNEWVSNNLQNEPADLEFIGYENAGSAGPALNNWHGEASLTYCSYDTNYQYTIILKPQNSTKTVSINNKYNEWQSQRSWNNMTVYICYFEQKSSPNKCPFTLN